MDSNIQNIDTSITHIRPRFEIESSIPRSEIMDRIKFLLQESKLNIKGNIVDDHVILDIIGDEVHYWSPQLNFRVEIDDDDHNSSLVSGLIGPRPAVWTLFMFIYFSVGLIGFGIASFGGVKILLGEFSYLVLALPIAILFMLTAYRVGKYGEKLAHDQIEILKQFLRDALTF